MTRPVLPRRLAGTGATVDAVPFYRNVPAADVAAIARDVLEGTYDVVVFTAPSTLARLLEAGAGGAAPVRAALRRMAVVAIGEVTAAACRQASVPVGAVADEPSDDGIVRAVQMLYA